MKKFSIQYVTGLLLSCLIFQGCSKDFLEADPRGTQVESNYYKNAAEAFNGLVAAYDPMGWEGGINAYANFACLEAAGDDCDGGGGSSSDVPYLNTWDSYHVDAANGPQLDFWQKDFAGVSRVNTILQKLDADIPDLTEAVKKRYVAEAHFLRAYYYFELVRLFRNVPLFTAPLSKEEIYQVEQATPDSVYMQIESDLMTAIAAPELPDTVPAATEGGRITKGAAHALLGKVYLYEKKWEAAAKQFAEVNGTPGGTSKYGYHLLADFSKIFRPDNPFNTESILEITHTSIAASGWGNTSKVEGFIASTMFGPRSYSGPLYYSGWGGCPVTKELFDVIHYDPRYGTTISDVDSLVKLDLASYVPGYQNTGHFVKKFAPLEEFKNTSAGPPTINYPQHYIEIRLADTYLMEAEALVQSGGDMTRAGALLNAVRARVGLSPVTPTLEHIYNERHLELATEGHRWYDLVRTGRAAQVLASKGFVAGKNELLPIPLPELNNTKLVQNPGY
ncbi:RagB/SusD family nutrient uptake outer membrane protein [Compostibacter hankyongensis]|uniref:RagB/SusD family nutrient uptake outer membrane protein n=1 Tax=Compostibacter hankyongensis TaxID=1007089 RepID=A0ABP8FJT0_9BACT